MARNGDGFHRRGGVWYFQYRDADGRYREKSTGKRKQSEAREFKHDFLEKLRQNMLPTDEAKWTLGQALDHWLEYRRATNARTSHAPDRTAAKHLKEIIGAERRLSSIVGWDIRRFQMKRAETTSPKTINNQMLALISVLKSARLWRPLEDTYRPLPVPKTGPGVALPKNEPRRLFETAMSNAAWFVALCSTVLAYATGCRMGEIKKLQLKHLLLKGDNPHLELPAHNVKNRKARQPALNDLGLWAARRLLERAVLLGATEPDHYLLPADLSKHTKSFDPVKGSGYDPTRHQNSWASAWESLKRAAGLPKFRFHDLRHTHITHAVESGVPIEVVMAQVGHLSPEMTRHYTHLGSEARRRAAAAVSDPGLASVLNQTSASPPTIPR